MCLELALESMESADELPDEPESDPGPVTELLLANLAALAPPP